MEGKVMLNNIEIIVMTPIFIILLVIVFKPIKTVLSLDTFPSCVLSVCVSALCIIGINHFLKDSIEVILLPYAAMAIAILLILLLSFIGQHSKEAKDRLSDRTIRKNDAAKTDNKNLRRLG